MKDTSRPHLNPSVRSAPYRKRKVSGNSSPARGARRLHDTSQPQPHGREMISPSINSRCTDSQPPRAVLDSSADDEHRAFSKTVGDHGTWRHTNTDGSARERPSRTNALGIYADLPGPPLRLPFASTSPTTSLGTRKAGSPPPGPVTTFLRSIELPDKPSGAPPLQESVTPSTPQTLRPPPLSTGDTNEAACTNESGYQVSLVYKGYPFTYDLSALPDDPKGTIALLNITQSDPGAYFLVGAHYRRTGRSGAACAVIRSLLNTLDTPSDVEKGSGDVAPVSASTTSTVTLVSPGSPCSKPIDSTRPVFRNAAVRPAMLLLAACELDISREHPDDPGSTSHATTARDLFRAVYGSVNDAIVAGAVRPQLKNALSRDFPSSENCLSSSLSDPNSHPPSSAPPPDAESLARLKDLEKELDTACSAQRKLQERLVVSDDRLAQAEDKVHMLESRSQEMLAQLDASRSENRQLRQRLVQSERMERDLVQCAPAAENRVWGRLKDLLFDNLGGVRGV